MPHRPTGLYIHIPFCRRKCFFCGFAVCIGQERRIDTYLKCLALEAQKYRGQKIDTVYIGGGTPTLLSETQLTRLNDIIYENFKIKRGAEFTIETNPDTLDLAKAKLLRSFDVNRVSVGAQSFNKKYLKFLGRTHTPTDIKKCFRILRAAGFKNIGIDLMFGFPHQTLPELKKDLAAALSLKSEHLSVYNLTIEPTSRFSRFTPMLPTSNRLGKLYSFIISFLTKHGLHQYEVSNFAKPKKESAHNILYWQCHDYIGLGLGAHSHINGKRFWNISKLDQYLTRFESSSSPVEGSETFSPKERLTEALLFGLRMKKGIKLYELQKRFGCALPAEKKEKITDFIKNEFLLKRGQNLRTTLKGQLVLDELCGYLI